MTGVFDPLRLGAVALDAAAAGHSTPDAIAARQRARLVYLLEAARQGSLLYRERLRGIASANVRLGALPVVTKEELMGRFDDWVTDPDLKLAGLRAFTADPQRIAQAYLGKYVVWESSGSSGQPGLFVQDAQAMATYDALEALRRSTPQPHWLDPFCLGQRMAFVGVTSGHFASIVSVQRLRQLNPWMAHAIRSFSILQATSSLTQELNEFAPTTLATYPTVAAVLADEAARGALHITPQVVWTGGETLSPGVRQWVEKSLHCPVRDSYGASEFLSIGWECAQGHLHANADWVILEPVDDKFQPVPAGLCSHSVLLTNLANTVQPLIRYDLGDQITVSPQRCACGSPLPVIEVAGRRDQTLTLRGPDGQSVRLAPLALTTLLEDQAGVFDFQLRQRDDRTLELRLSQRGAEGAAAMQRCRKVLQTFARQQGLDSIHIIEKMGATLPRGRSGKIPRVLACAK